MPHKVKSLIITGFGINCEEETAAAYRLAGAEVQIVHLNDILLGGFSIHDYDILNFPGGLFVWRRYCIGQGACQQNKV